MIVGREESVTVELLAHDDWTQREERHVELVDELTASHRSRIAENRTHPVEDFLFTYYSHRPAQLRRWHAGARFGLLDAGDRAQWRFHRALPVGVAMGDVSGGARPVGDVTDAVVVDPAYFLDARGKSVRFIHELLGRTRAATPSFGCFGLHEWAMVYQVQDRRHLDWPLRLGADGTDEVVRDHQIKCSHYDAFRFFTPAARGRNLLAPDLWSRDRMEQPGCLHASMDLYKWAYRLVPIVSSELLLDCFLLAREIREIDMRASPYDLTELGYPPIPIETPSGKTEYVTAQRSFADRGQELRDRLLSAVDSAFGDLGVR
ncbi:hypothetical protein ABIB25_003201 [Nakamurella sp. UYEF19]|uniref:3-methyladenine DNA glycosylase n=1 Tax=Nakamurella sp. UYEF19 TaxID=1756392 RepID=UPI003396554E